MIDIICPSIIVRASQPTADGSNPSVIKLLDSLNTANIERIVSYVGEPLLLRLLVCKEEKKRQRANNCPYPEHENNDATKKACANPENKLAHIYVRDEKTDKISRSCVVAFIEGLYLSKTDELLEIFKNTVEWLSIAQESPYFYIVRYGNPVVQTTINDSRTYLNKKIKEKFDGYLKNEDTCFIISINASKHKRKQESIAINRKNNQLSIALP